MVLPINTAGILQILSVAAGIFAGIQGLKNIFPNIFNSVPNLGRWLAALAALVASVVPCLGNGTGLDLGCVINAIAIFLGAVGIYHSVAQASGNQTAAGSTAAK